MRDTDPTLPAEPSTGSAADSAAAPGGASIPAKVVPLRTGAPKRGGERGRILVIDENADMLAVVAATLGDSDSDSDGAGAAPAPDFVVDLATSGEDGLERAARARAEGRPYALAFVALRLPGGWDGLHTVEALWRTDARLQVVLTTATGDPGWGAITARLGRTDRLLVLKKPFEVVEVLQAVCALVEKWRREGERAARLDGLERRLGEARREGERLERELRRLSTHDALTGLPNRNLLGERLERAIARAAASGEGLAVLALDLHRFKFINDSLGLGAGDGVLRAVAERLVAAVGETDTVARLGCDEFVVVAACAPRPEAPVRLARAVHAALARPFELGGEVLHVGASMGVCVHPEDGEDGATLLKHAAAAMHSAKDAGTGEIRFFARELGLEVQQRVMLEAALRRALEAGEFELHYQPQVDLGSGRVTGVEALVRWRRDDGELVSPVRFIPLAEETGLITPLGEWVLREACRQTRAWHAAGHPELAVSVNVSAHQLRRSDLARTVRAALDESGLDAGHLELELTESALMEESTAVVRTLDEIRALGVKLALDDFGTGYSSLAYLKRFHFDKVKIDRSFVRDVPHDADDASLTRAIIAMARSLGLTTIAEGVETAGQLDFLLREGCDGIQGYLFSAPLPAAQTSALLRERIGLPAAQDDAAGRPRAPTRQ